MTTAKTKYKAMLKYDCYYRGEISDRLVRKKFKKDANRRERRTSKNDLSTPYFLNGRGPLYSLCGLTDSPLDLGGDMLGWWLYENCAQKPSDMFVSSDGWCGAASDHWNDENFGDYYDLENGEWWDNYVVDYEQEHGELQDSDDRRRFLV